VAGIKSPAAWTAKHRTQTGQEIQLNCRDHRKGHTSTALNLTKKEQQLGFDASHDWTLEWTERRPPIRGVGSRGEPLLSRTRSKQGMATVNH